MLNHLVTTALLGGGIPQAGIGAHDHPISQCCVLHYQLQLASSAQGRLSI